MPVQATCYIEDSDVRARLATLDLKLEPLLEVAKHYGLSVSNFTPNHPSWQPGITSIGEAIFALRENLAISQWLREEEKGFALTAHPHGKLAINVAKGTEATGEPDMNPETSSTKGPCTDKAIDGNRQLMLDIPPPPTVATPFRPVWYLLLHCNSEGVRAELSLPVGMSDDRHISLWSERIILPKTKFDHEPNLTAGFDDGGYDVLIERKK